MGAAVDDVEAGDGHLHLLLARQLGDVLVQGDAWNKIKMEIKSI